ncbi:Phospholipid-lipopolysaccharide ABC transporter [Arcticibacter svalbardensis MN12-7]|uniref:Phospholipid-lipopolysaccharide ABC transporter n=1 Tax=Arcticibacter svalbardensis MN12-7 TaxID=1150600 RepID=R9GRT5_9SPHI|nr:ABC transporter ATP-binding protein [Arcticibacter svalbardensis]EOR94245.1 Phospholipid-lipopolysaccharide ABC transporter [Arcticibacter svalbardensis MN12-7]
MKKEKRKVNYKFLGEYFNFFYEKLGIRFLFDMVLNVMVSCLDGIGLAMFIPLLKLMDNDGNMRTGKEMGNLHFLTDMFNAVHVPVNIYSVLGLMGILFATKGGLKFFQLSSQVRLKQTFIKKLRFGLTSDMQSLSYNGFLKLDAGKIQNILTSEVQKLQLAITHYLNSVSGVAMLLTYVIMAFLANWQFAILVAIGSLLSNLVFSRAVKTVKKTSMKISSRGNVFNSHLIEAVHYFKYLKATNQFKGFSGKIRKVIRESEALNTKVGYYQAVTTSIKEPMVMLIVIVVIIVQIKFLGGNLGSIILSLLLFYRALSFLMNFQNSWQNFIQNVGAIDSVSKLIDEMKAQKEIQVAKPFTGFQHSIEIKDLIFKYGQTTVLKNVNIQIPKNKTIALVGESGSGKTTLINIVTGLLPMESGNMFVDGVPVTEYNLDSFRSRIGYISQEAVIFKDDVFNNVTFWAEPTEENKKHFWKVCEMSSLTDFVESLPEKELTSLGDKGMLISGGQKQRISIARELYKNADILILDEATSALDSETELVIQQNIEKLQGSYTMIIIAHRLSTIKNADRIYMLDRGEVTYSGKFKEMVEKSERFKRMVSLQQI